MMPDLETKSHGAVAFQAQVTDEVLACPLCYEMGVIDRTNIGYVYLRCDNRDCPFSYSRGYSELNELREAIQRYG